ncbi:4027_t:CDS:2 [Ambispora gerdemannii]|uniref:4027_t:CDS:1 n=1 Tax=Ambispora gerdemannii TaxID=144530 RepID=A0A9N9ADI9_9GLOM|nr:4027_t:CDS:2 [Ambispora gerdemannii]
MFRTKQPTINVTNNKRNASASSSQRSSSTTKTSDSPSSTSISITSTATSIQQIAITSTTSSSNTLKPTSTTPPEYIKVSNKSLPFSAKKDWKRLFGKKQNQQPAQKIEQSEHILPELLTKYLSDSPPNN